MSEERKPEANASEPRAEDKPRAGISRREFARRAALASAPAIVVPAMAAWTPAPASAAAPQSSTAVPPAQAANTSAASAQAPNLPKLSAEGQAEVDARIQSILGQYGSRFSEEQKTDIRRLCTFAQPPLDRLRAYHLDNADGSALYLKPLVEREKKPVAPPAANAKPAAKPTSPASKKP